MRTYTFLITLLLTCSSYAQKVVWEENRVTIESDTILYFDAERYPITREAHSDSLETGKYILSIKGTDEMPEIHLTYKHPDLETLIGKRIEIGDWMDLDNNSVKIGESGDYTIISFWNKTCRVCIRELTALDVLMDSYPGVRIVALTPDTPEEVQALMKRLKLDWDNVTIVPNDEGDLTHELQLFVYPSNIVIDRNKEIKGVTVGGNTRELLKILEKLCVDADD